MVDPQPIHGASQPIGPVHQPGQVGPARQPQPELGQTFDSVLRERLKQDVQFSAHARDRLRARDIALPPDAGPRLNQAVDAAAAKAATDALVLLDGIGLVVNVPNRVVVTAIHPDATEPTVITNIDSTVIAARSATTDRRTT